jgi:carbonic anhydrase
MPGHIVTLINEIKRLLCTHLPEIQLIMQSVKIIDQVTNLRDLDPILHKKYKNGEILIVGAVYDIHTGKVEFYKKRLLILPQLKK